MTNWKFSLDQNLKKQFLILKNGYKSDLEKARDKKFTHFDIWNGMRKRYNDVQNDNSVYKGSILNLRKEIAEQMMRDNDLDYNTAFEENTKSANQKEKVLIINQISLIDAYTEYVNYLVKEGEKYKEKSFFKNSKIVQEKSPINWTNGNNKNDFVKLIYALHKAELINNGNGDITKIVESLGLTFGVSLGKGWQSNFSKNKNSRNNDYNNFEIFDKVRKGYELYLKETTKKVSPSWTQLGLLVLYSYRYLPCK